MSGDESDASEGGGIVIGNVVEYCPHCTLPPEYCEYSRCYQTNCKAWLAETHPELLPEVEKKKDAEDAAVDEAGNAIEKLNMEGEEEEEEDSKKKKKKKRGGKVATKEENDEDTMRDVVKFIHISKTQRQKRKFITVVRGLDTYGLKLKDCAKAMAKKFACAASVGKSDGESEISIQGDVSDSLPQFIVDQFKVEKSTVFFMNKGKKTKAFK